MIETVINTFLKNLKAFLKEDIIFCLNLDFINHFFFMNNKGGKMQEWKNNEEILRRTAKRSQYVNKNEKLRVCCHFNHNNKQAYYIKAW